MIGFGLGVDHRQRPNALGFELEPNKFVLQNKAFCWLKTRTFE
jgi:hypothetical protein